MLKVPRDKMGEYLEGVSLGHQDLIFRKFREHETLCGFIRDILPQKTTPAKLREDYFKAMLAVSKALRDEYADMSNESCTFHYVEVDDEAPRGDGRLRYKAATALVSKDCEGVLTLREGADLLVAGEDFLEVYRVDQDQEARPVASAWEEKGGYAEGWATPNRFKLSSYDKI